MKFPDKVNHILSGRNGNGIKLYGLIKKLIFFNSVAIIIKVAILLKLIKMIPEWK